MSGPLVDRRTPYDPAWLLTFSALAFVGILIVFVCVIIGMQIWSKGEANTESWAALTGLIGWVTGVVGTIFSNRFGTTSQSATKDATIQQQANTAAVIASTAASPSPATPIKADEVKIDAQVATVTEAPQPTKGIAKP